MGLRDRIRSEAHLERLRANASRRNMAVVELEAGRAELARLIRAGREKKIPMTHLCQAAGISRERGYELLKGIERRPAQTYNAEGGP